jgi:hypothetical protein
MKKFIAAIAFALLTACSQAGNQNGIMQDGMKEGMQCQMMKDGKLCSCCAKMMQDQPSRPAAKGTSKPASISSEDHKHHPAQ